MTFESVIPCVLYMVSFSQTRGAIVHKTKPNVIYVHEVLIGFTTTSCAMGGVLPDMRYIIHILHILHVTVMYIPIPSYPP